MSEISSKLVIRRFIPSDYDGVANLIRELAQMYNDEFNEFYFRDLMQKGTKKDTWGKETITRSLRFLFCL